MAITFPTTLDSLTNPTSNQTLAVAGHTQQHGDANDAIEALEAKVGVDGSAVTTSHDYKLSEVLTTDKAVGKSATQTLTNKTLTSPVINVTSDATGDIYYRNSGGLFTRLAIGSSSYILSVSVGGIPEWIANPSGADASTTVKGVLEIATIAEREARTATGGTGANLAITTANLGAWNQAGYAADAGSNDTYVITLPTVPGSLYTGMVVQFKAATANTGAATLNVNGLGAKSILRPDGSALANGDIAANQVVEVGYDGTNFLMLSPLANSPKISTGVFTKNLVDADATQNIAHGLGRVPRLIKIIGGASVGSQENVNSFFVMTYDGTTVNSAYLGSNNSTSRDGSSTANFIIQGNVTNTLITGTVTMDATNISIAWVKTGSPTNVSYGIWEAFA